MCPLPSIQLREFTYAFERFISKIGLQPRFNFHQNKVLHVKCPFTQHPIGPKNKWRSQGHIPTHPFTYFIFIPLRQLIGGPGLGLGKIESFKESNLGPDQLKPRPL